MRAIRDQAKKDQARRESERDQGILEWVLHVRHGLFNRLRARLVATDTKDRCAGKCSIEVWAEDEYGGECTELAYCRGMLCPREGRVIVLWLGRSNARTVHQRARGRRCVDAGGTEYTLAEAVFGLVVAIASLFSVSIVELQAKDNGTGKLVDLYLRLGFTKRPQEHGEILWMEALTEWVAQIAPCKWSSGLVPESFDARAWMHDTLTKHRIKENVKALCREPPKWSVSWPPGCRVVAKLSPSYAGHFQFHEITRVQLEVALIDPHDEPLAWASANARVDQKFCRLTWLGRQKSQAVHQKVRGRRMYKVPARGGEDSVTAAIALLGVVAAIANRLDAKVLHLQVPDEGSAKLAQYLCRFGLAEAVEGGAESPKTRKQGFLSAPCGELVQRCLPLEWESQLRLGILPTSPESVPRKVGAAQKFNSNADADTSLLSRSSSKGRSEGPLEGKELHKQPIRDTLPDVADASSHSRSSSKGRSEAPLEGKELHKEPTRDALPDVSGQHVQDSEKLPLGQGSQGNGSDISLKLPAAGKSMRARASQSGVTQEIGAVPETDAGNSMFPCRTLTSQMSQTSVAFFKPGNQVRSAPSLAVALQSGPHTQSVSVNTLRPNSASDNQASTKESGKHRMLAGLLEDAEGKQRPDNDLQGWRTDGFKGVLKNRDPLGPLRDLARKRRLLLS